MNQLEPIKIDSIDEKNPEMIESNEENLNIS